MELGGRHQGNLRTRSGSALCGGFLLGHALLLHRCLLLRRPGCQLLGLLGKDRVSFADIGVFALFGNMTRCLPELDADVLNRAPGIYALCESIGSSPSLARFVAEEEQKYGKLYCGGQIEESIRKMLAMDAE